MKKKYSYLDTSEQDRASWKQLGPPGKYRIVAAIIQSGLHWFFPYALSALVLVARFRPPSSILHPGIHLWKQSTNIDIIGFGLPQ